MTNEETVEKKSKASDGDSVPPDGGWGWLIVICTGLLNLFIFPSSQQFGLLYRERLIKMESTNAEMTTILNFQATFQSIAGLFIGPLYHYLTYRQVGLIGTTTITVALLSLSFVSNLWSYFLLYSMLYGLGLGIMQSTTSIAISTYFKDRLRIATGLAWTTSGCGPIFWPYIVTALMDFYGQQGTLLLFSSFAAHSIPCVLLYQPVHWHTKPKANVQTSEASLATTTSVLDKAAKVSRQNSLILQQPTKLTLAQNLVRLFDLDLLKDPIFVNLLIGMHLANFVETNFSVLTPFILNEFHFEDNQIATFLSLLGTVDLLVRLTFPFAAEKIGWDNRMYFLMGVLIMALGRIVLVHTQGYTESLAVAVIVGFGKGLKTVFMNLTIPAYVSLQRLPGAMGLSLICSGIMYAIFGPAVGWIRDATNDYVITIHILNVLTYLTAVSWILEVIIIKLKR